MRRVFTSLMAIGLIAVFAAGTVNAKVQISFRHWGANEGLDGVFKKFNASQDEVEVVFSHVSWEEFVTKTALELAAGGGPDMFSLQGWPDAQMPVSQWVKRSLLLDLTPYWRRDAKELAGDRWPRFVIEHATFHGKLAGLPYAWSIFDALQYNADVFRQSGVPFPDASWTWETFAAASKKFVRLDGQGNPMQWGVQSTSFDPWRTIESMVNSTGGSLYNAAQTELALNSGPARRALNTAANFILTGAALPGSNWSQGKAAMRLAAIHWATADKIQAKVPFDPGLAVTPMDPVTAARRNAVEIMLTGINANTKHPEAAWKALKFFTEYFARGQMEAWGFIQMVPVSPEGQRAFLQQNPETVGPQMARDLPAVTPAMAATAFLPPRSVNPLAEELNAEIKGILGQEWGKVIRQEITVEQFISNASRAVNPRLKGP